MQIGERENGSHGMSESFDVGVVLGGGPRRGCRQHAAEGRQAGCARRAELIGGECTNWGCIPSKTLLRPAELRASRSEPPASRSPTLDLPRLAAYRDYMVSGHDDSKRVASYEKRGVTVVKAPGAIAGPGRVEAPDGARGGRDRRRHRRRGSRPADPRPAEAGYWTNREATT